MKVTAIVPMRHDSERVVGKNYRLFHGEPLYRRVIHTLLDCPQIDEVVIDTDSNVIWNDAQRVFPSVRLLRRPEHLRPGTIPMNDVLMHTVAQCEADLFLQTHCTNPLLKSVTISTAVDQLTDSQSMHDSLFSVTRIQARLWNAQTQAVNHDPGVLQRTQDLAPIFEENSSLYIFSRELLERRRNRIGHRPLMFEMNKIEAWDIDEEDDFVIAEALYAQQHG